MNHFKQKFSLQIIRFILLIILVTGLFASIIIYALIKGEPGPGNYEIDTNGIEISNKPSKFKIYQNRLYVSVPSNGNYIIPEADLNSIRILGSEYDAQHIAVDKNNVYCGNLIIDLLNPATTYLIGDGYLSDGEYSYYCSPFTVRNPSLSPFNEAWQGVKYNLGYGKKPQSWWYPIIPLKDSKNPYKIKIRDIASNGEYAYFRGLIMPQVNVDSLFYLDEYIENSSQPRESEYYSSDGKNIYFKDKRIDSIYQKSMYSIRFGTGDYFLFNPTTNNYFKEYTEFDKTNTPYKLLNKTDNHAYHALFLSPNGVYFYHRKKQALTRAGENPFVDKLIEISPDIYSNQKETFYLSQNKKIFHSRQGRRTCWIATSLNHLENTPADGWEKIGSVKNEIWEQGTLWRNGESIYYFDEQGSGQFIPSALYLINDSVTMDKLQNHSVTGDEIRKFIRNKQLIIPPSEKTILAKEKYRFCLSDLFE